MHNMINQVEVVVICALSMMLISMTFVSNKWRDYKYSRENRLFAYLLHEVMLCLCCSVFLMLCDGKPGMHMRALLGIAELFVFAANIVVGVLFWKLVYAHLGMTPNKYHLYAIRAVFLLYIALLIINLFTNWIYGFDELNQYFRGPANAVAQLTEAFIAIDSMAVFFYAKKRGGILKFFPIWQFVFPTVIGIVVQTRYYGIIFTLPCLAVSVFGMVIGMQKDSVYTDRLTGAYNRFYLEDIKRRLEKSGKHRKYALLMLDMNDFKHINDEYGHAEGDNALRQTVSITSKIVNTKGNIIRYAGDEFIIVLNTDKKDEVESIIAEIRQGFNEYNRLSGKSYMLSASIGYEIFEVDIMSVDDIMKTIDARMYEDKKLFYANRANDRRASY